MTRYRDDLQAIDIATWPTVDTNALSVPDREAFVKRQAAIEGFIRGTTLREIDKRFGVSPDELYWLLDDA